MVGKAEELAEIDVLFARADSDHDGQINFSEFRALELDEESSDEDLRVGFGATDSDGNGRIK